MPRKISGGLVILVGVVFIVVTLINNLFAVGPAFEEMITDFRPLLAEESLNTARADVAVLEAAGEEFQTAVAPGMAQALGMTPEEFAGMVQGQYPAVAQGMQALPEITATFSGLIDTLDSQRALFESADAIPTDDLPATTVPWIITISALLAIAIGVMLFMPGRVWAIARDRARSGAGHHHVRFEPASEGGGRRRTQREPDADLHAGADRRSDGFARHRRCDGRRDADQDAARPCCGAWDESR